MTPTPNPEATATAIAKATAARKATATARAKRRRRRTPTPAPLTGRIAFPVFNDGPGVYDVYIANIDGSNMQRLLHQASQPDFSPNGQMLAFRQWKSDERGIATINLDGSNYQRRTHYLEDSSPRWSPDGGRVAFFTRREFDRQSRLYWYGVFGLEEVPLFNQGVNVFGEMPSWLPDGRILYRATYPHIGLAVVNSDGSNIVILIDDTQATAPAASPDGKRIVYMSHKDGNWEIYAADSDGSNIVRLTNNGSNDGLPVWSPDGTRIAFVSDRSGQWAIWVMNPDGSGQQQLFALPGSIDGRVEGESPEVSRGWTEESISWTR
ncbi:MAG: hypothetical protein D6775_16630 [Caldilineae bacterium]|nr:MAG: hypothetical protein D6775_16630 [Caldilineae bacterium]